MNTPDARQPPSSPMDPPEIAAARMAFPAMTVPTTPALHPPVALETPLDFFILGPRRGPTNVALWAVNARLLQYVTDSQSVETPWLSRAVRELFIGRRPAAGFGVPTLLPGTMIAVCRIRTARITINGVQFDFLAPSGTPVDMALLLQAEDPDWTQAASGNAMLSRVICLAGEIPFDRFVTHPSSPPGQPKWPTRLPFLDNVRNVALSSSGLVLDARAKLPWTPSGTAPISEARYLVEVRLPVDTDETTPLVVLPDLERLDDARYRAARADYNQAFADLARMLQPSTDPAADPTLRRRLRWSSLELTDPSSLPGFSWDVRSKLQGVGATNTFRFDPGAWTLLLTDQPVRVPGLSPRGVLTAGPEVGVSIDPVDATHLLVDVRAPGSGSNPVPPAGTPRLVYSATAASGVYTETIALQNVLLTYRSPEAARRLRAIANLPDPQLDNPDLPEDSGFLSGQTPVPTQKAGLIDPPVLFGVVPMEDGWAQLPFLNVNEQILIDALPEPIPPPARSVLLAGAASFGTDRAELFDPTAGEPGWNVTILDADGYEGVWSLKARVLDAVSLTLHNPELSAEGLFWLATGAPTPEDALPTLDDWLGPIVSLPLRTPDPVELYPSPFLVRLDSLTFTERPGQSTSPPFSGATLGVWEFAYVANLLTVSVPVLGADGRPTLDGQGKPVLVTRTVYEQLMVHGMFDPSAFWADPPLVWRRHGRAPTVQALPMTQSSTPPNHPSASRQLFPFALPVDRLALPQPGEWRFRSDGGASWPRLVSQADPATSGAGLDGLTLVSLGLPGLVFDPNAPASLFASAGPADRMLPAQYRHEVALLDEINALASLPKDDEPRPPGEVVESPPPGLQRQDYEAHWAHLAELAFSATAESRDALSAVGSSVLLGGLIEPLAWPVSAGLASDPYPGTITFADANGRELTLSGEGRDALRGIEASFKQTAGNQLALADPAASDFQVVGESMTAALTARGTIRDQRGLTRGATTTVATTSGLFLKTRVALADDPGPDGTPANLWTALAPITLAASGTNSWDFWFRDLPAAESASGGPSVFNRTASHSVQRRGENNPAALTRRLVHHNSYEWRLGASGVSPLPLGPLAFYPLSLEAATFDPAGNLTGLDIVGRLHLPTTPGQVGPEPADRSNAVRLSFASGTLVAVALAPLDHDDDTSGSVEAPVGDWPLSDRPDTPRLLWSAIRLTPDKQSLVLKAVLSYRAHAVSWTLPPKTLIIPFASPVSAVTYMAADFRSSQDAAISIQAATLTLDFSSAATQPTGHHLSMTWRFVWGQPEQLRLVTSYVDPVLAQSPAKTSDPSAPPAPDALTAVLDHLGQGLPLVLRDVGAPAPQPPNLDSGAVQVEWSGVTASDPHAFQVLPGFHLTGRPGRASRGFGIMVFSASERPGDVPVIDRPAGGFFEALFECAWGNPLQASAPAADPAASNRRVFGSSAGQIDAAYTAAFDPNTTVPPHAWSAQLLLNGFVEVKSLVSWPSSVAATAGIGSIVTLPAARPTATPPALSHVRHTANILFNQHVAPAEVLQPSPEPHIFLQIKPRGAWKTQAVVEHQLVLVELNGPGAPLGVTSSDRDTRVTIAQEVRFCAPSAFGGFLNELKTVNGVSPSFPVGIPGTAFQSPEVLLESFPNATRGYLGPTMIDRFTGPSGALASLSDKDAMIVESSVPALLRIEGVLSAGQSNLAYLPGGTTRAVLASLNDYQSSRDDPRDTPSSWFLLALPFLGRTQPESLDGLDGSPTATTAPPRDLRVDPVLQIDRARRSVGSGLDRLALALANWEDRRPTQVDLAEFDMARHRFFTRLDPSSLRESWSRLNLPAPKIDASNFASVLANSPTDVPGTMGRPEVLARVLDPKRTSLPPSPAAPASSAILASSTIPPVISWHPDSLFVFDIDGSHTGAVGSSGVVLAEFGFLGIGAQLAQAGLIPAATSLSRHPAAAVLPARLQLVDGDNVQPVSVAVSPFIGLGFIPTPDVDPRAERLLAVSELVCLDAQRKAAISVASRFWYPPGSSDALVRAWASEIQARYAADSPVAVVRLREIFASESAAAVTVVYRFLGSEGVIPPPALAKHAPALRAKPAAIRFAQGQYGGPVMPPGQLSPFELAPPQVAGVQPIRLDNRPGGTWPWGLSALRVSVRQLDGSTGVAGPPLTLTSNPSATATSATQGRLWWQSLSHQVQYAVPEASGSRKILPSLFRARAIPALLPAWPNAPLPDTQTIVVALNRKEDEPSSRAVTPPSVPVTWQPILPGGYTVVIAGARPGAPFLLREQMQVQDLATDRSVCSGAVPVMHRMPRPVLLPRNKPDRPEVALQTWAGAFDPTRTVLVGDSPMDAAFLGFLGGPIGLDLSLTDQGARSIRGGAIPGDWDGSLRFQAVGHGMNPRDWFAVSPPAQLSDGSNTFTFRLQAGTDPNPLVFNPDKAADLSTWLQTRLHGAEAFVTLSVGNDGVVGAGDHVGGFQQTLTFPLRVARDQGVLALPYRPSFFLFEDPEYNRRLASTAAQASTIVTIPDDAGAGKTTVNLTLAADRHEYNATGAIHYIFYVDPPRTRAAGAPITGDIQFSRIDAKGLKTDLLLVPALPVDTLADPGVQDLLAVAKGQTMVPGDTLILSLTVNLPGKPGIQLGVSIVAEPVIPVPDAAYALLRRNPDASVECVQFAFSPEATRVELVDPDDLRRQIVRRRAVFRWRDTVRIGRTSTYAIQKTTATGSTHFPDLTPSKAGNGLPPGVRSR